MGDAPGNVRATHRDGRTGRNKNAEKTHCVRDHLLVPPNLMNWCLPQRRCYACYAARSRMDNLRRRGHLVTEADFIEEAARIYAERMEMAA